MPRIDQLTPEQVAMLPVIRDEWIAHGLSCATANRELAVAGVNAAYREAGLEPPRLVVWLDSPYAGAIGAHLVSELLKGVGDQVGDQVGAQVGAQVRAQVRAQVWAQVRDQVRDQVRAQVRDQVGDQVRDQVRAQVRAQVGAQVRAQVRAQVWDQVGDQVRAQVRDQVGDQVRAQVGDQVRDQVRAQVWDQVWAQVRAQVWAQVGAQVRAQVRAQVWAQVRDQVGDQVGDQVRAQVWDQVWDQVGDQVGDQVRAQVQSHVSSSLNGYYADAYWLSFYDTFRRFGLSCCERLAGLMQVAQNAGWWFPLRGAVVLTARPLHIKLDNRGRLHCEDGPAVTYPDGFSVFSWHGTRVPADLVEQGWSFEQILGARNAEVRRCAIERLGAEEFERHLTVVADAPDPGNAPYRLRLADLPSSLSDLYDMPARILLCTNGSDERDGTRRRFALPVPAHHEDPVAAAAEMYDFPVEAYRRLQVRR